MNTKRYVPALSFKWLTPFYDTLIESPISALHVRKNMLESMGDLRGKRVLDVGCGTGSFSILIKQNQPDAQVVGLDGDPQILEMARAKAENQNLEIQFDQGMSFDMPYPDASFDIVLTSLMLHHLNREEKQGTAREMIRVLKPGGRLFGVDFAESRGKLGGMLKPLVRNLERIDDNLDGFLPKMFAQAGFRDYRETRRYVFGALAAFQGTKE